MPFLVLIPIFAAQGDGSLIVPISLALAKGALAFAVIFYAGQYLVRPAVRAIAATHSHELFTLFILLIALLAAWLTWQLGLSLAMGAFLAGIMLAETEYQHHIENEIRPFRDVLMGLFFISVGSQFDWHIIFSDPISVAVLTLGLIVGKGDRDHDHCQLRRIRARHRDQGRYTARPGQRIRFRGAGSGNHQRVA